MADFFQVIKRKHVTWMVVILLCVLVGGTGILYWQDVMKFGGLVFVVLMAVLLGLVVVLGMTVTQRNGFLDGFRDGRDGVKKHKKS